MDDGRYDTSPFMTIPGIALFYAGMVRKKNVLSVVMQSFAICCAVTIVWYAVGYSLAFFRRKLVRWKF